MNYKRFIKSRKTRFAILKALSFVPDSIMISVQYRIKTGRWPNLKHPKRFTEKLQLYKMKYRNPLMPQCVDKYTVRSFVENKGLNHILNEIYGVFDKAEDIDFDNLPTKFVIKTTDGGGGNTIIIVKDKSILNIPSTIREVNSWLNAGKEVNGGREWAYSGIEKSRVLVEKLLEADDLIDYKFFCFNGEPKFLYVITDRKPGEYAHFGIYDMEFNKLPIYRSDERRAEYTVTRPKNYEQMVEVARKLSEDFPHVRVDLYNIDGKIYFGELTFYDGSGYFEYDPDSFDFEVGAYFSKY